MVYFCAFESVGKSGMAKRLTVAVFAAALAFAGMAAPAQAETWQCATFARFLSGVKIFGDAWTWWEQATGKYAKGFSPDSGAVLVFKPYGAMKQGHVAVVSQVLTDRIIQVTHANWSPIGGKRGQVEQDVTVVDVSDKGDWSQVKVWYDPSGDLGRTVYPTYGFIYQAAQAAQTAVASLGAKVGADR
jgi:surface antigen